MKIATYALLVSLLLVCICAVCAYDSGGAGITRSPPALGALKDSTSAMMIKYVRPGFSSSAAAIGVRSVLLGHRLDSRELEEEACTPCFGGSDPTNLDGTINLGDDETMTCEDLRSDVAPLYPSNDEVCPQIQLVGHTFCGCPSPPPDSCTVCFDGSVVPDPDMIVDPFGDGNSFTCGEFASFLLDLDADDDADTCSVMQNTVGVLCGCPASPDPPLTCNICPSGSTLSNPDESIDMMGTCGDAANYAEYTPANDESCAFIRDAASLAGCCSDTSPSDSPCPELPTPPCDGSRVELTINTGDVPIEYWHITDNLDGNVIEWGETYTTTADVTWKDDLFIESYDSTGNGGWFYAIDAGDIDKDGDVDIVFTALVQMSGSDYDWHWGMMLNDGDGNFDPPVYLGHNKAVSDIKVADVDGDGNLDVVTIGGSPHAHIFYGYGNGTFTDPVDALTDSSQASVQVVDIDGDGDLDILVVGGNSPTLTVNRNDGERTFVRSQTIQLSPVEDGYGSPLPWEFAVGDFNNDGFPDVVISASSFGTPRRQDVLIFLNSEDTVNGGRIFSYHTMLPNARRGRPVAVVDINNDGFDDIICTHGGLETYNWGNNLEVFLSSGDGFFSAEPVVSVNPDTKFISDIVIADVDQDGYSDVVVSHIPVVVDEPQSGDMSLTILYNDGSGSLDSASLTRHMKAVSSEVAIVENFNQDTHLDIAAVGGAAPGKLGLMLTCGVNYYPDVDGDGYGDSEADAVLACDAPAGHVDNNSDCNDNDAAINPAATGCGISYTATTCLGTGSYSFVIVADEGNGIDEPGEYTGIVKVNGEVVASGGVYVDDAVPVSFTVPALPPTPPPGPCVGSHVETTINTDDYPGEIAWAILDDSNGSNVEFGGPYITTNGSYTTNTCLGAGSYTFIIYDGYGDGINEPGGYHVKVDGKEVVSGAGNYGCGESNSFTVPSYEYDIPVMDLSFSFGGEGGNFIRYDCVLDLPDYDVIVLDHACQARVDEYFDISKSVTARSDGRYDAAVTLDILPETMTNPLLFDDSDEANVMYKGCVRIELIRGDDGKRVFFRQKSFDITVDMTTGFSSSFESSGADEEGDTVEGEINNDLEAYVCDEVGNRYDGPISMSSFGHYFCFEPSENVAVAEISSLVFEKLGGESFTAIQDGLESVDVYRIREVEGGDNVVQVHLRLPNGFFYSEDTISVSGEVLSTPDVGRRLGNEEAETGRSFFFKVAVQPRKNGMVQIEYTASLAVSGMALPQGREDVRAAAAKAFDSALGDVLPDGIFAKTLSIGLEDVSYLRTSRRLDEEEEEVEILFALSHMIPCEDADCADVETLSAEAFEAARDSIEFSVADGTLDDAIHETAVTYNVAGLEAVKVDSESVIVSEPNVEILSATATMAESSRSTSAKKIVAPIMSVLAGVALSVLGILFVTNKRKRNEENED